MLTSGSRKVWSVLVWFTLVLLPIQFILAGYGAFSFKSGSTTVRGNDWMAHDLNGTLIGLVIILILISGLLARLPSMLTRMTVGLFVLMVIQVLLAGAGDSVVVLGALHPLNGVLITGLAVTLALRARTYLPFRGATESVPLTS